MKVLVFDSPDGVADAAAELVATELAVPGPTTLGLAGGTTPAATYERLAAAGVAWDRVTLWLGDERWVPEGHADSNAAMARARLGPEAANSLITPGFGGDPRDAATGYQHQLEPLFAPTGDRPATVLLGIGDDGHTASLFPGTKALSAMEDLYVANYVPRLGTWRLTATVPLLAAARHVVFLVTGEGKASVTAEILDGGVAHPARLVADRASKVTWMLDAAAAGALSR